MWSNPTYRHLLWALLFSLLVHFLLLRQASFWPAATDVAISIPIQIELVQVLQPKPRVIVPRASSEPKEKKIALPPAISELRPIMPPPAEPPFAMPEPAAPEPVTPAPAVVEPLTVPEPVPEMHQAVAVETRPEYEPLSVEEEVILPPRHVEIDYRILHKGDGVGEERHRYQARDDGSYSLTSIAEPQGLLALALSDLKQQSEGMVTQQGLRPTRYVYQYGKRASKLYQAMFDWQAGKLQIDSGGRQQTVSLPEGTQDLMSFMYQFMFTPPLQRMSLPITNGRKLRVYAYVFEGEETLPTRMGDLRCIHILRQSGSGEEKTELWLAADYHYLPVKISRTEEDGTVTERIAVRLQLD